MVMLSFSVLDWKNPFWANLIQKNQNYLHKLKFGTKYNSSMLNLMVMFIFAVLDQKRSFGVNLIKKKIKFVSLRWDLVHRRIQICIIR